MIGFGQMGFGQMEFGRMGFELVNGVCFENKYNLVKNGARNFK